MCAGWIEKATVSGLPREFAVTGRTRGLYLAATLPNPLSKLWTAHLCDIAEGPPLRYRVTHEPPFVADPVTFKHVDAEFPVRVRKQLLLAAKAAVKRHERLFVSCESGNAYTTIVGDKRELCQIADTVCDFEATFAPGALRWLMTKTNIMSIRINFNQDCLGVSVQGHAGYYNFFLPSR